MRLRHDRIAIPVLTCLFLMTASPTIAATIYGLTTTNGLVAFSSSNPGAISSSISVNGLQGGENLVGIDFRPADGNLYGFTNAGRLYTINTSTGGATLSATLGTALNGTAFGTDFNPVVDRFRIVTDARQNLRLTPGTSATSTDGTITYNAADPNAGATPALVGSAYTNNFPGAPSTTLYGIDLSTGLLVTQIPPNNGILNTVGALGVSFNSLTGFDINRDGIAYASLNSGASGVTNLYTINLTSGAASLVGAIGGSSLVADIAVQPVPEPATWALMGITLSCLAFLRRKTG